MSGNPADWEMRGTRAYRVPEVLAGSELRYAGMIAEWRASKKYLDNQPRNSLSGSVVAYLQMDPYYRFHSGW
jgi:hypothetical protein